MKAGDAKRLTILFGAGASHDSGAYLPQGTDQCRPPLAKDLFASTFDHILAFYPRLRERIPEVRMRLSRSENIETILRDLYDSAEKHLKYWPFQISLYLRHLFWTFSLYHESGGTNLDALVRPALESTFDSVMFVSLNYDLLLDLAIEGYECVRFENLNSYIPDNRKWLLLKPHGSVNWAREIDNCPADSPFGHHPSELNERPHFKTDEDPKLAFWARQKHYPYLPGATTEGYLYPQIAIPADNVKGFACPVSHIERAVGFIRECADFLLIGFSGNDQDVIQLLQMMPIGSRLTIVANGKQDAHGIFERICSHAPGLRHKSVLLSPSEYTFSQFLERGALDDVLNAGGR